jgi:hypothetical protein
MKDKQMAHLLFIALLVTAGLTIATYLSFTCGTQLKAIRPDADVGIACAAGFTWWYMPAAYTALLFVNLGLGPWVVGCAISAAFLMLGGGILLVGMVLTALVLQLQLFFAKREDAKKAKFIGDK